jgi:Ca-activated chloride channel family protein
MKIKFLVAAMILLAVGALMFSFSPNSNAQIKNAAPTPTPSPSASPPQTKNDEVIRVSTDLVTLTATVTDKNGRYRADLKQSDFTVYEDGTKQELAYFNTGERVPVSLGIVFDTSGSMEDKIEGVQDAVEHFVKNVSPNDEIFLVEFNDDAELVQGFTDDRKKILRAVESLVPRGSTALYDAITLGLQKVREGKNKKRALLLLTDGNDTASAMNLQTALSLAKKSEVIIYALGLGHGAKGNTHSSLFDYQIKDTVDMRALRSFADATGGNAYYLEEAHEGGRDRVDEAAEEVAAELKQQYTLGYYPTNQKKDGGFRQVVVEVNDKSLKVRAKRGYYSGGDAAAQARLIFSEPDEKAIRR